MFLCFSLYLILILSLSIFICMPTIFYLSFSFSINCFHLKHIITWLWKFFERSTSISICILHDFLISFLFKNSFLLKYLILNLHILVCLCQCLSTDFSLLKGCFLLTLLKLISYYLSTFLLEIHTHTHTHTHTHQ